MSTPPPPWPGNPWAGQTPFVPQRRGTPVWVWVVGGVVAFLLLLCCMGTAVAGVVLYGNLGPSSSPTTHEGTEPPPDAPPNTDASVLLPADKVEEHVADGLDDATEGEVSCPEDLVLVEGSTMTCTSSTPEGDSVEVEVEVDWAVVTGPENVQFYLSFTRSAV